VKSNRARVTSCIFVILVVNSFTTKGAKTHEGECASHDRRRGLAAILAADVAGYSRLMGEDEAGTAKIVRERREAATPIVRSFGGRLVKTTGDGVLLEFPSVVAAVECAIVIQTMMAERNAGLTETKRVVYRVGVHLGDVLIEGDDILGVSPTRRTLPSST
jgi:class 3 adenylate cyclase